MTAVFVSGCLFDSTLSCTTISLYFLPYTLIQTSKYLLVTIFNMDIPFDIPFQRLMHANNNVMADYWILHWKCFLPQHSGFSEQGFYSWDTNTFINNPSENNLCGLYYFKDSMRRKYQTTLLLKCQKAGIQWVW